MIHAKKFLRWLIQDVRGPIFALMLGVLAWFIFQASNKNHGLGDILSDTFGCPAGYDPSTTAFPCLAAVDVGVMIMCAVSMVLSALVLIAFGINKLLESRKKPHNKSVNSHAPFGRSGYWSVLLRQGFGELEIRTDAKHCSVACYQGEECCPPI